MNTLDAIFTHKLLLMKHPRCYFTQNTLDAIFSHFSNKNLLNTLDVIISHDTI